LNNFNDTKACYIEYTADTYGKYDVCLEHGSNATAYDINNKQYIDLTSGIGVNSLGFCNANVVNAATAQLNKIQHISNLFYALPATELAKRLCEATKFKKVFLANSGAEANEGAIKVARKKSFDKYGKGRNRIVTLVNSFHGRTVTTLSATGQDDFHNYFFPFTEGFDYALANDITSLKNAVTDKTCAVMIGLVQGEGGVIPLEIEFVKQAEALCKQKDLCLIVDEVQTGIGRTGKFLCFEHFGIYPDIVTLAKGLGGGLPIGAVLMNQSTMDVLKKGQHGTTFGGNPICCAAALEVIKVVQNQTFLNEVLKKSEYIKTKLLPLEEVISVTGLGLMLGIELKTKKAADVVSDALKRGVLLLTAKEKVRLLPPLTITFEELKKGISLLIEEITA